jgi:2'-5' RNA ligase
MRTFLAVEIPEHIRKQIDIFLHEEAGKNLPIKWVTFNNLHITLKFLGEIDEKMKKEITPALHEVAKTYRSFNMNLEGIGCFPSPRNPRVLWIGAKQGSEMLCKIAQELEEKLARFNFKKEKRFHPHLTIGRIKKFCLVNDILEKEMKTESFPIRAITLFKSTLKPEGPIYEELQKFPLGS